MRDARHQRVDIAVDPVEIGDLRRDPVGRQPLFRPGEMTEDMAPAACVWVSLITLRKSGIWQTSQRSRTAPR